MDQGAFLATRSSLPNPSARAEIGGLRPIEWVGGADGHVRMIDQSLLPNELRWIECASVEEVVSAIRRLAVRGAPAIGIAAAMGVVLGVRGSDSGRPAFLDRLNEVCVLLKGARPTAVNLAWATDRMRARARSLADEDTDALVAELLGEAKKIRDEDAAMCRAIGAHGYGLIPDGGGVLTHCNAGALATAEYGTALALMYEAHTRGRRFTVYADETRPLLQGSRLTAWELMYAGIDVVVICDNMAAQVMKEGKIDLVITGADRIAANGDVANKIGTYGVAVLAKAHGIGMYVAAPSSTFDLSARSGADIPIEERSADEIRRGFGIWTAPQDVRCYCPAFDVTPAQLIRGLVTERGVIEPVNEERIRTVLGW